MLKQRLRGRVPMLERISIEAIFMGQENKNCAVAFSIMSITSPNSYGYSLYPILSYYISGTEPILKTPSPNSHKAFIISVLPPLGQSWNHSSPPSNQYWGPSAWYWLQNRRRAHRKLPKQYSRVPTESINMR
ncbi:uncharacterized protein ARMOST_08733 [Armillaria ostoyae]|uniref:Uncharacterized protein n=1 Tax=Armillaria ostoyae TaxID=47428 RepID=A0A284R9I2_ARMOS|nr:uncharacterized protein ARMOST_08733 [Armillaria ostoyae]